MAISLQGRSKPLVTLCLFAISVVFTTAAIAQESLKIAPARDTSPSAADQLGQVTEGAGLSVGDAVADFSIRTFEAVETSLNELLQDAPLLVIFYRGGWCPYCNFQIRELTVGYAEFKARGVMPVLISVDRAGGASAVQKTYDIPFPVLSDTDLAALTEFNVRLDVNAESYAKMQGYGIDLEDWSGEDHHVIAKSSAFIVDQAGIVKWAHVSEDYTVRPTNLQLLAVIDALREEGEI